MGVDGVNDEDIAVVNAVAASAAVGAIMRADLSQSSNYRAKGGSAPGSSRATLSASPASTRAR